MLVCDSIGPSGIDLYNTGLPDACYALETLFFFFFFPHVLRSFWRGHTVCPFGMANWLNRLRAFIIYIVFSIKKKKCKPKQNKNKKVSLCRCVVSSASWLTGNRSLRAEDRIRNQEQRSKLLYSVTHIGLRIAVDNLLQVSHLKIALNMASPEVSIISLINWYFDRSTALCCVSAWSGNVHQDIWHQDRASVNNKNTTPC